LLYPTLALKYPMSIVRSFSFCWFKMALRVL
jgi:hypothetical protein